MSHNDEYNDDDGGWVDDDSPVYRSLSINPPGSGTAQQFGQFGDPNLSGSLQTYDGDDEPPVYRSLCVAAPLAPPSLGGFQPDSAMGLMGSATMSSQSKSVSSTHSAHQDYPPIQLSGVPISSSFLDPCHVYAVGNPEEIAKQISIELEAHGIDFVFKAQKAKWKCVGYECGQHVDFRVRLYSPQGSQGYPLEFQRRQGPLLQFNRIYQGIVYKLSQRNFVRDSVGKPAQIVSPPLLALASADIVDEGVSNLVQMASSNREDVRHQALITFTKLSPKQEYSTALSKASVLETMVKCLNASSHVRRCALTVLSDLCAEQSQRVAHSLGVVDSGGHGSGTLSSLYELAAGSAGADMETRRQSCRLLAGLTYHCHDDVLQEARRNQTMINLVASCDSERDPRLKKHLMEMRDAFQAQHK